MKVPRICHPVVQRAAETLGLTRSQHSTVRRAIAEAILREPGLPFLDGAVRAHECLKVRMVERGGCEEIVRVGLALAAVGPLWCHLAFGDESAVVIDATTEA